MGTRRRRSASYLGLGAEAGPALLDHLQEDLRVQVPFPRPVAAQSGAMLAPVELAIVPARGLVSSVPRRRSMTVGGKESSGLYGCWRALAP